MSGPRVLFALPLLSLSLLAQAPAANAISATGSATISVPPDQAQLQVGVVTQATTAQDAAQQNATLTTTVVNAVKQVLGTAGTIQTVGYSVSPRYDNTPGKLSTIIGYQASNTLQVTMTDLSLPGRIIDAANQAGANSVGGLNFGLQNAEPVMQQALSQAAKQALAHAGAIATGLGVRTGAVVSAQEGASVVPYTMSSAGLAATPTPVETGTVNVTANVTVNVQMVQ
jgi:uncharacterized protein YggE